MNAAYAWLGHVKKNYCGVGIPFDNCKLCQMGSKKNFILFQFPVLGIFNAAQPGVGRVHVLGSKKLLLLWQLFNQNLVVDVVKVDALLVRKNQKHHFF